MLKKLKELINQEDMDKTTYYDLLIHQASNIVNSTAYLSQSELALILNMSQSRVSLTIQLLKAYLRSLDDELH